MKKITAGLLVLSIFLTSVFASTVFAADVRSIALSGQGVSDKSVIIDLEGKDEKTMTYYIISSPTIVAKPEFYVDVTDIPSSKNIDVSCVYDEFVGLYKITAKVKAVFSSSFSVKVYAQQNTSSKVLIKSEMFNFEVINSDGYESDVDPNSEYDYDRFQAKILQARSTGVLESVRTAMDNQTITAVLADEPKVSVGVFNTLREKPTVTVKFIGANYFWTVNGYDLKRSYTGVNYNLYVTLKSTYTQAMINVSGAPNIVAFSIPSLRNLPGTLDLSIKTFSYPIGTSLNVYRYENGAISTIVKGCVVDSKNLITVPINTGGEYFYTTTNVK